MFVVLFVVVVLCGVVFFSFVALAKAGLVIRVGSHVVLAWIHCTEKWPVRGRKAISVKCK